MDTVKSPQPLSPAAFQVLLALAGGQRHGYAIMQFVGWISGEANRLGAGTLYRTVARLLADGLIEEIEGHDTAAPHDARRRYYRLTESGRLAAEAEAQRLARLVSCAADLGLISTIYVAGDFHD